MAVRILTRREVILPGTTIRVPAETPLNLDDPAVAAWFKTTIESQWEAFKVEVRIPAPPELEPVGAGPPRGRHR
jgi:hypothetical protein